LAICLNPWDTKDNLILDDLKNLAEKLEKCRSADDPELGEAQVGSDNAAGLVLSIRDQLALLLKHDWERAKQEARPFLSRLIHRIDWTRLRQSFPFLSRLISRICGYGFLDLPKRLERYSYPDFIEQKQALNERKETAP
jgi:hypothetical protein